MKTNHDYTGKKIFVGIDVHKATYSISVVCDGKLVKRDTLPAYPQRVVTYLQKFFNNAEIRSAYEAGFSGFGLHRHLKENGIDNIVVHAASIEIGSRDRVKTDKRDSMKIAFQLSANRLRGIFVPSTEMEDRRELSRLRSTFVKDRNRIAARLKQKANYYGLIGPEDSQKVCRQWIERLLRQPMGPGLRHVVNELVDQWETFNKKIKELDHLMEIQAVEDEEKEKVYRSVKGIGKTSARILSNELGDMLQFSSERGLFSYTGLTPSEYSSGEHTRKGHISRQGKAVLRGILIQCSWVAIKHDPNLREIFERIAKRAGCKRAIVAVGRRLIGRLRACFRNKTLYQVQTTEAVSEAILDEVVA